MTNKNLGGRRINEAFTFMLPKNQKNILRQIADDECQHMADIMRTALDEYLARRDDD